MWTRGKDHEQPGKFAFELFSDNKLVKRVGGFATAQEADRAAEVAQRQQLFPDAEPLVGSLDMTDDELLAELEL